MNKKSNQDYVILIVDDLVDNLMLLSRFIEEFGYQSTFAKNGKEAIARVQKNKPDLILLDLMMPVMDGLECCKQLKAEPNYRDIPIIFITASTQEKHLTQAFELGASDYITKPFKSSELQTRIKHQFTILKQAQKIQEQNLELKIANQKLAQFNDMICHDIRNPLSNIKGFTRLLEYKLTDKLDPKEQKFLQFIERSSNQIHDLITGLLLLSEVKKINLEVCDEVNLSEIVGEILSQFQEANFRSGSEFIIQPNLVVYGDEKLLKIALHNILANAWKYSSKQEKIIVEFGTLTKENLIKDEVIVPLEFQKNLTESETIYFIRDRGVGFDVNDADKVFEIFTRLHGKGEFEGTGIGLAIVKNVINIHGGQIWANAKVNEGATFYFYLGNCENRAFKSH